MFLQYLEFDLSEDGAGGFSAAALASPAAQHTSALIAEVQALWQALSAELGAPGPLDDGHAWDLELQLESDDGQPLDWPSQTTAPHPGRISLSLHLAGGPALQHALEHWSRA